MVLGFCVLGSGGVGWLLGPFVGNAVFGLRYRGLRGEIERVSWMVLFCGKMRSLFLVFFCFCFFGAESLFERICTRGAF